MILGSRVLNSRQFFSICYCLFLLRKFWTIFIVIDKYNRANNESLPETADQVKYLLSNLVFHLILFSWSVIGYIMSPQTNYDFSLKQKLFEYKTPHAWVVGPLFISISWDTRTKRLSVTAFFYTTCLDGLKCRKLQVIIRLEHLYSLILFILQRLALAFQTGWTFWQGASAVSSTCLQNEAKILESGHVDDSGLYERGWTVVWDGTNIWINWPVNLPVMFV